jgi:hypothetical protein
MLQRLCEDEPLRRRFAQASRAKAERQDWKPIFDELEDRYYRLTEANRRSSSSSRQLRA